jgi:hypothetical protein
MPSKSDSYSNDLRSLLEQALQTGDNTPLESYLTGHSNLPGPRGNLELINAFAGVIGEVVTQPAPPVKQLEALLDGWANLSLEAAPVNHPREILPAAAVASYGQVAAVRPEWWEDEVAKLRRAAANPRWRVREIVAQALQRMLAADWPRAYAVLLSWLPKNTEDAPDFDPLLIRAVVAAIAEPPLLTDRERASNAVFIHARVLGWFGNLPGGRRKEENVRVLRQALGYTLSVAVAAKSKWSDDGINLIRFFAKTPDADIQWIVRENLKKNRLKPWLAKINQEINTKD